jgi:hypothetical protein
MRKTSALNAKDRKLCKTRKCWKYMWRRGCNMGRRSPSREKQMRRYDIIFLPLLHI